MITILRKFYCYELVENDSYAFDPTGFYICYLKLRKYHFVEYSAGTYYAPAADDYEEFINYTKNLPLITHPSVFGMHENADIMKDQKETELLFYSTLLTQV